MKEILTELFEYKSLDKSRAREILLNLAQGNYNNSQVASFLTVYMMRTITTGELEGFRDAMLELCVKVDLGDEEVIDLCGTGGDGKNTFNISTLSAFVVAGAGYKVAKHGNNGVSSVCGSSNLLTHFGHEFTNDNGQLRQSLDQSNICFLHAPLFHPAMKNVAPIRQELGVKTFFNMLGPMVNPSFPGKQLVGVFSLELLRLYNYLFQESDKDYLIIHSLDGYDEISLTGPFKIASRSGEEILHPGDLGLTTARPEDLYGGETVEEAAVLFQKILEGNGTREQNDVVVANSGLAIHCFHQDRDLTDSIEEARSSLESGEALNAFKSMLDTKAITS